MSLTRKIASSTVWQIFSRVGMAVLGLVTVKVLVSGMTVEQFGEYTTAYKFLDFFGILADFGLYVVIIREMTKNPEKEQETFSNMFSLRMTLAILVYLIAVIAVYLTPQYRGTFIPFGVTIAGLAMIVTFFNGMLTAVLQRHLDMRITSLGIILGKVTQAIMFIGLFWYVGSLFTDTKGITESTFYNLFWIGLISSIIMTYITYTKARQYIKIEWNFDYEKWKKIIIETFPYGMAIFLGTVYLKIDVIMLSLMKGNFDVGIYGISTKLLEIIMIFPQYFLNSLLPIFTLILVTERSPEKFKVLIEKTLLVMGLLVFPIVFGGISLAYPIIATIGDPEYLSTATRVGADAALKIILLTLPFTFYSQVYQYLLISQKKHSALLFINLIAVIINVILNIIFIPKYGFMAAAITTVISEFFVLIVSYTMFRENMPYKLPLLKTGLIILISYILGQFIYAIYEPTFRWIYNYNMPFLIGLFGVLYVIAIFAFKIVDMDEIKSLLKKS